MVDVIITWAGIGKGDLMHSLTNKHNKKVYIMSEDLVANSLVGAVWTAAQPGEDPVQYGHAT